MGKIALPSTSYCSAFTTASLSVNGQIFSTDNPPISYTLSGTTATISDGTGVLAVVELTGELVEAETQGASEGTNYCAGSPQAELTWISGSITTQNTPISYDLTATSGGIEVDWGGGDVDMLTGTSSITTSQDLGGWFATFVYLDSANGCQPRARLDAIQKNASLFIVKDQPGRSAKFNGSDVDWVINSTNQEENISTVWTTSTIATSRRTSPCGAGLIRWRIFKNGAMWITASTTLHISQPTIFYKTKKRWTVTTNTGDTSERATETPPTVTLADGSYTLSVSDATGVILEAEYEEEPTDFKATCYDYDIKQVNYACQGECPGGTEFQCECPANNSISCYGFDPDNPNLFRALFTTQIVG